MIKGSSFNNTKAWVDREFPLICKEMGMNSTSSVTSYNEMDKKDMGITEKEKEIELIWEDLSANTKAIKVIEDNILSNIESLDINKNTTFEKINDMEVKMKNMEKRMDDKLLVFSEELEKKFEKKI